MCCPCGCKCGYAYCSEKLVCKACGCECDHIHRCHNGKSICPRRCDCPCGVLVETHGALTGPNGEEATSDCKPCGCFPSDATVKLANGKTLAMSDLQIGDRVQTGMKSVTMSDLQIGDRVQTGMKSVTMSELQIGDRVQTGMKSVTMSDLQIGDRVQTGMKSVTMSWTADRRQSTNRYEFSKNDWTTDWRLSTKQVHSVFATSFRPKLKLREISS